MNDWDLKGPPEALVKGMAYATGFTKEFIMTSTVAIITKMINNMLTKAIDYRMVSLSYKLVQKKNP